MENSSDENWNDIVNVRAANEMCQYQYLIIILLKSLLFKI